MDGRVKTLHPKVHGGLLGVRDNPDHVAAMDAHDIAPIDLVVVNLYPFLDTVMSGAERDDHHREYRYRRAVDGPLGGEEPCPCRDCHRPRGLCRVAGRIRCNGGGTTLEFRKHLAAKAYALTAAYDSTISQWFAFADQGERWPETWTRASSLKMPLRYGENPHQQAALYVPVGPAARGVAQAEQVQGKELSYNNLNDANAALELIAEFRDAAPTIVIVKHANPCGVATRDTLLDAWAKRSPATASRRSAGSSPAIARSTRRRPRRSPRFSPKSWSPPTPTTTQGAVRQEEEPAAAAHRRAARSGARRADHRHHRRRDSGPGPR